MSLVSLQKRTARTAVTENKRQKRLREVHMLQSTYYIKEGIQSDSWIKVLEDNLPLWSATDWSVSILEKLRGRLFWGQGWKIEAAIRKLSWPIPIEQENLQKHI